MKMKHILYTIGFILVINSGVNAQTNLPVTEIKDVKVFVENKDLHLSWSSDAHGTDKYWEVQGSSDGKSFTSIGIVLGADPATGNYQFKQPVAKIKTGYKYYRVLHIESEDMATASNTILLTK